MSAMENRFALYGWMGESESLEGISGSDPLPRLGTFGDISAAMEAGRAICALVDECLSPTHCETYFRNADDPAPTFAEAFYDFYGERE